MITSKKSLPAVLLASFLGLGGLPIAHSATLVNDNFTLSSGTGVGTVNNTSASGVGTYSTILGTAGMSVTTISGFGSGNVLSLANNTNTYFRAFDGAASLTLGGLAANETLSMSFDVRFVGTFGAAQNFSFGFIDNDPANSVIYANVNLNSGSSEFRHRAGSFNMSDAGATIPSSGWTEPATISGNSYSFQLGVTKQENGDYLIEYYRDGALVGSNTEAGNGTWATSMANTAISGIAFRHSQTPGLVTYIDNVTVASSAIPEPSAFALLGGAGVLGLALVRRRRHV